MLDLCLVASTRSRDLVDSVLLLSGEKWARPSCPLLTRMRLANSIAHIRNAVSARTGSMYSWKY